MNKVIGSFLVWGLSWLLIAGFIQFDLSHDSFKVMGRAAIIVVLLGVLPPLFTLGAIAEAVKDASAQSLFRRLTAGESHPSFAFYLRAFQYDTPAREPQDDLQKITHAIDNLWRSDRSLSAWIADLLKRECGVQEVVSIMPPRGAEALSIEMHHGTGRIETKSIAWQEEVIALAKAAVVTVIAVGPSRGVQWEFDQLRALGRLGSTIVIVPPLVTETQQAQRVRSATLKWAKGLGAILPPDPKVGFALTFNSAGNVDAVRPFSIDAAAESNNRAGLASAIAHACASVETSARLAP